MNINHHELHSSYDLSSSGHPHQQQQQHLQLQQIPQQIPQQHVHLQQHQQQQQQVNNVVDSHSSLQQQQQQQQNHLNNAHTHTIQIHLQSPHMVETLVPNDLQLQSHPQPVAQQLPQLDQHQSSSIDTRNPQMTVAHDDEVNIRNEVDQQMHSQPEEIHQDNNMTVDPEATLDVPSEEQVEEILPHAHNIDQEEPSDLDSIVKVEEEVAVQMPLNPTPVPLSELPDTPKKNLRPRRKAAAKKAAVVDSDVEKSDMEQIESEMNILEQEKEDEEEDDDDEVSDSSDDESSDIRRCIVCMRHRKFTEDIFDSSKQLYYHIDVLIAHLNIQIKGNANNTGICPECMDHLQRWHIFNCAIVKRHEAANSTGEKYIDEPIAYESFESRVYRNYKKMGRVKEVFLGATHAHYVRRHLTEKDWDFFCDHLFHSNSVKSEKSRELERFLTSREKMSLMFCLKCQKLIPNGKKGYTKHMETEHNECPVMYPCDICGNTFPEKDMTASTEDFYPHWISHFYFNKCDDCGKRFPTKRALGQHRHAVHKNRQVKCEKCGKVLANKMSLDLHLLRHLPENEKKKYMIKCKICKKKIAQWNLKSHMATHNDDRPWKCDHCDATFKMKGALVSHRDVVHFNLKNHVCSICGEAFKSASSLRGHVRRHEGRRDYKCDVCHKEYYTYSALKGHKVVHQTARDFICEICGKAFKKKKALEEHGTIHTGEKPHQCPICGREIRVKSNLYKHMKIHKKNPNDPANTNQRRRSGAATGGANCSTSSSNNMNSSNNSITTNSDLIHSRDRGPVGVNTISGNERNESMSSASSVVDMSDQPLLNNVNTAANQSQPTMPSQGGFLNPHFQANQANMVHTLTMQHQHQDLLNVPVPTGHFYNAPQYFGALDQLQN